MEKTPAGSPLAATARVTAAATISEVPGWASCALTTTGQPAARAEAVSPPATEKASGKLLAANTATGPMGTRRDRTSGRRAGLRSGSAWSMRAPFQLPSRSAAANSRSCPVVRPTSPVSRGRGRPVSRWARSAASAPTASISSAASSSRRARCSMGAARKGSNADSASSAARATSLPSANWKPGSSAEPSAGSTAWKAPASPTTASPAMYMAPTTAALAVVMWSLHGCLRGWRLHAKRRPRLSDGGVAVLEPAEEPARHQPPLENVPIVEQPLVGVGGRGPQAVGQPVQPGQVEHGPGCLAPVEQPQLLVHGGALAGQPLEPVGGVDAVPAAVHDPGRQPVRHRPADQRARHPLTGALPLRQRQAELRDPRVPGRIADVDPVQGRVGAVDPADVMNVIHQVAEPGGGRVDPAQQPPVARPGAAALGHALLAGELGVDRRQRGPPVLAVQQRIVVVAPGDRELNPAGQPRDQPAARVDPGGGPDPSGRRL